MVITRSDAETRDWGRALGEKLRPGDVIALTGPLGAGKTTLTKGIAEGLGCPDPDAVCSPTFTLLQEFRGRHSLAHVDAYRLAEGAGDDLGLEDYLDGNWVVVVEWAERVRHLLPERTRWIVMRHAGEDERGIDEGVPVT